MQKSPYKETIFLDTDTHILHPLDELFDLLKEFDLAVQFTPGGHHYKIKDVPRSFYEPSAGILVWKKNQQTKKFFEAWKKYYKKIEKEQKNEGAWDQRSLRWALWNTRTRFCPIPAEYQCCLYKPEVLHGKVKMLHGRNIKRAILNKINLHLGVRIYLPQCGILQMYGIAKTSEYIQFTYNLIKICFKQNLRNLLHKTRIWRKPEKGRLA